MDRKSQLKDRDVRGDAAPLDPVSFLDLYVKSNFPQTSAIPSQEQKQLGVAPSNEDTELKFKKKMPTSGTSYDRPQVS